MSMIYECPNCHTPQAAGRTACRHCGAEFESPVPDDALLPDGTAPEPPEPVVAAVNEAGPAEPALEAESPGATIHEVPGAKEKEPVATATEPVAAAEPMTQEAIVPQAEAPRPGLPPDFVSPPPTAPAETLPYQSSPYPTPAYQSTPIYAEQADVAAIPPPQPPPPLGKMLTRALMIAFPIVLVVVLGAVFFAHSLESGQDTAPTPMPAPVSTPVDIPVSPGAPAAPPYTLNGAGASAGTDEDPRTRRMVGRWESKNLDFYLFNGNKTGTRGSLTGKGPQGTFLWALVQNHLILYADKQEKLTYSRGPDDDTMFLRVANGKYVQYARTKP